MKKLLPLLFILTFIGGAGAASAKAVRPADLVGCRNCTTGGHWHGAAIANHEWDGPRK